MLLRHVSTKIHAAKVGAIKDISDIHVDPITCEGCECTFPTECERKAHQCKTEDLERVAALRNRRLLRCEYCGLAVRNMFAYSSHFAKHPDCRQKKAERSPKPSKGTGPGRKKRREQEDIGDMESDALEEWSRTEIERELQRRAMRVVLEPLELRALQYRGGTGVSEQDGLFHCSRCQVVTNNGEMFFHHLASRKHWQAFDPENFFLVVQTAEKYEWTETMEPEGSVPAERKIAAVSSEEPVIDLETEDTQTSRSGRKIIRKKFSDEFVDFVSPTKRKPEDYPSKSGKKPKLDPSLAAENKPLSKYPVPIMDELESKPQLYNKLEPKDEPDPEPKLKPQPSNLPCQICDESFPTNLRYNLMLACNHFCRHP